MLYKKVLLIVLLFVISFPSYGQLPERPWIHPYHQTLTMKMFMCDRNGKVYLTLDQALEVMRKIDNLTRGIPKIIYLVGWQYNGHDSGYPSWGKVNSKLKRIGDSSAVTSLIWLMNEGSKYNTTVSLHINMLDASKDSPLWEEYIEKDIVARNTDGTLRNYVWGYPISYTREWEEGLAQRRIDSLCDMLPLKRAGTVHIDAFHTYVPEQGETPISPYHGITTDQEIETQKKIFRYWRDKEIDLTSEFDDNYRKDPFIGLQPMAWHFGGLDPMKIPPTLYCGGKGGDSRFGQSMLGENKIKVDPVHLKDFIDEFCQTTLVWYYLNRLDRISDMKGVVTFSGGVTSRKDGDALKVQKGKVILQEGGNVFVPALWQESREIIAYSKDGYVNKTWKFPAEWKDVDHINIYKITLKGLSNELTSMEVKDHSISLSLAAGEAIAILPQ